MAVASGVAPSTVVSTLKELVANRAAATQEQQS
jgi:hypothetical protein